MVSREFWNGKKVLVTGHTGFKGSWLCMLLNYLGAEISGYALDAPTIPSLYELCNLGNLVKSNIADIRDFQTLSATIENFGPEIIIHMAAQPLVRKSYSEPILTYQTNVMGTVNLLEAVRLSKNKTVRVVLNVTTDKCYENKEWIWPYRENDRLGGYDPYSNSKACSELVTSAYMKSFFNPEKYSEHNVAIATARAGNVIGGGDWAEDRLIPDIIRAILDNRPVIIRNPGAVRPWQHVLEPLSGYLSLCEILYNEGPAYSDGWNFGPEDSDAKNVEWIAMKLCDLWQNNASYEVDNIKHPHEAFYLRLDCSKAKNNLGWQPKWNIETTLNSIIFWYKAFLSNCDMRQECISQIEEYYYK